MADRLHRIHAAPASGKGGNSFDLGAWRWRADGGDGRQDEKRAIAHRISLTWNLCEGIPTEALEAGAIRAFYAAVNELLWALGTEDQPRIQAAALEVERAREAHQFDRTDGRLHDCEPCQLALPEVA